MGVSCRQSSLSMCHSRNCQRQYVATAHHRLWSSRRRIAQRDDSSAAHVVDSAAAGRFAGLGCLSSCAHLDRKGGQDKRGPTKMSATCS